MSRYLSRKIQFITLFSMLSVVFIHSYNYKDSFLTPTCHISEGFNLGAMIEYCFSNGLLRFSVPLFFIISGYLFYRNFESIKASYLKKAKSRFFSLFLPYLIWCSFSIIFILIASHIKVTQNLPIVAEKTQNTILLYYINPPAFQLWYMQQLIIFTVLCPLIYLAVKHTKGLVLIPLSIFWIFDLHFIINSQAIFFYVIGAFAGVFHKEKSVIKKEHPAFTTIVTALWLALSVALTVIAALNNDSLDLLQLLLYRLNEVIGVVAVWVLFDHIFKRLIKKKILILASTHSFIIFAFHEPLLHIASQLALGNGQNSIISHLIIYICMPISVIAICILVGMFFKKISKNLYSAFTGGRPKKLRDMASKS